MLGYVGSMLAHCVLECMQYSLHNKPHDTILAHSLDPCSIDGLCKIAVDEYQLTRETQTFTRPQLEKASPNLIDMMECWARLDTAR